jgi:hypothetical protein
MKTKTLMGKGLLEYFCQRSSMTSPPKSNRHLAAIQEGAWAVYRYAIRSRLEASETLLRTTVFYERTQLDPNLANPAQTKPYPIPTVG